MDEIILSYELNDKVIKVLDRKGKYILSNNGEETYCINLYSASELFNKITEEMNNVA